MSNDLAIIQDETRWGSDPYGQMIAEAKDRQQRLRKQEAAAKIAIDAQMQAQRRKEQAGEFFQLEQFFAAKAARRAAANAAMEAKVAAAVKADPDLYNPNAPQVETIVSRARRIVRMAALEYGVTFADVYSEVRTRSIVHARQIAMYEIKRVTDWSLPAVGRFFGGKDHSTVIHSLQAIAVRAKNPDFKSFLEQFEAKIDRM